MNQQLHIRKLNDLLRMQQTGGHFFLSTTVAALDLIKRREFSIELSTTQTLRRQTIPTGSTILVYLNWMAKSIFSKATITVLICCISLMTHQIPQRRVVF